MKKDKSARELIELLNRTLKELPSRGKMSNCTQYGDEDRSDYVHGVMTEKKRIRFERHFAGCPSCLKRILKEIELYKRVKQSTTEEELSLYLNRAKTRISEILRKDDEQVSLMAASTIDYGKSTSFGLAVDDTQKKGFLIECRAEVSVEESDDPDLEISGVEVIGELNREGRRLVLDVPRLNDLAAELTILFQNNPYLSPFRLNQRRIVVYVIPLKHKGFFKSAQSLALPIVIAILAAATGKKVDDDFVFSGKVRAVDGSLSPPVDDVSLKLETARKYGKRKIVLPLSNAGDCPEKFLRSDQPTILFFSRIDQVLHYVDLIKVPIEFTSERLAVPEKGFGPWYVAKCLPDSKPATKLRESEKDILAIAAEGGMEERAFRAIMKLVVRLAQHRDEARHISTAFIMGSPEKICRLLPGSDIQLSKGVHVLEMEEDLCDLSTFVNGSTMGFVVNREGLVHSIRKLNINLDGDYRLAALLSEPDMKYATISAVAEAVVFYLTPGGSRIHVFSRGDLVWKYLNGRWQRNDQEGFMQILESIAESKKYDVRAVQRVAKVAIRMADLNLGALFVIHQQSAKAARRYADCLARLNIQMIPRKVYELGEDELINFAKEDGAVIIDHRGYLRSFSAYLQPRTKTTLPSDDKGVGSRHISAMRFTAEVKCLAIVVSVNSEVTAYCDGESVFKI